jgi:hypothetical protein
MCYITDFSIEISQKQENSDKNNCVISTPDIMLKGDIYTESIYNLSHICI